MFSQTDNLFKVSFYFHQLIIALIAAFRLRSTSRHTFSKTNFRQSHIGRTTICWMFLFSNELRNGSLNDGRKREKKVWKILVFGRRRRRGRRRTRGRTNKCVRRNPAMENKWIPISRGFASEWLRDWVSEYVWMPHDITIPVFVLHKRCGAENRFANC